MSKSKNSTKALLFGLILLIGLIAICLYFFFRITKENFVISVKVSDSVKLINNANVTVNDKIWSTDEKGETRIPLKVKESDKIIITTSAERHADKIDTVLVDKERYKIGYTNLIVLLNKK